MPQRHRSLNGSGLIAGHAIATLALGRAIYSIEAHDNGAGRCRHYAPSPEIKNLTDHDETAHRRVFDAICEEWRKDGGLDLQDLKARAVCVLAGSRVNYRIGASLEACSIDFDDFKSLIAILPDYQQEKFRDEAIAAAQELVDKNWDAVARLADRVYHEEAGILYEPAIREIAGNILRVQEPEELEPEAAPVAGRHILPIIDDGGRQVGEVLRLRGRFVALTIAGCLGEFFDKVEAAHAVLRALAAPEI